MALRAFDIPEATLEALRELADITDAGGQDRLTTLLVDALRTYEWIVAQQAHGKTVVALERTEVELLERSPEVSGARESLTTFVPPDKQAHALEYFAKAS
jgi:hypothetical protein